MQTLGRLDLVGLLTQEVQAVLAVQAEQELSVHVEAEALEANVTQLVTVPSEVPEIL